MLNVAPQKERIPDHLRAMAEQDDKSLRPLPPSEGRKRDATAHSRPIYRPPAPGARGMGLPRTPMAQPAS